MSIPALISLTGLAVLMGLKHGFDADHLASIDGLSRLNISAGRPRLARASGLLFSLGHGAVVMLAALTLGSSADALPQWLDQTGAWISIVFLTTLGLINLRQALSRHASGHAHGLATPWLLRSPLARHPAAGLMVGALFALSIDTLTQATWFGVTGAAQGGTRAVLLLSGAFAFGMICSDALNGLWVAHLIRRSQGFARRANRVFAALVACSALCVAALGALRFFSRQVDTWAEDRAIWFSLALIVAILFGYALTRRESARQVPS